MPMHPRRRTLLALGASLARRGPAVIVAIVVSVLTALGAAVVGFVLARRGSDTAAYEVPLLASSALAWGGGFLHAFAASAGALRRDRTDGIRELVVTRTTSLDGYLFGRTAGLALVLVSVVGGGTLFTGLVAMVGAAGGNVGRTLQATLAASAFAVGFGLVIAPVALAALGARARTAGWATIIVVLLVPELIGWSMHGTFPIEVTELVAIPSALAALRASLASDSFEPLRCLRALAALAVFAGIALVFLRRDAAHLERESGA